MKTTLSSTLLGLLVGVGVLGAEDAPAQPAAPAPAGPVIAPEPSHWSEKGRIGIFFNNAYVRTNSIDSPDPTIRGSSSSTAYLLSFDGALGWKDEEWSVDQSLILKYGRIKQPHINWSENNDEIHYEGVGRRMFTKHTFLYVGVGALSDFTAPQTDPDYDWLDPFTVHASSGIGQLYDNTLPVQDRFEWRLGVRVHKTWGESLLAHQDAYQIGPEAFLRYERTVDEKKSLRYFLQYEGYSEFKDMAHVINLITAGLVAQLDTHLTVELSFRAYYESRPKEVDRTVPGYNEWGMRQDTLVGLTYTF